MTLLKKLLLALGIFIAVFIGIGFALPSQWKVGRAITINASPEKIYPLIANLETGWPQWSAFDKAYSDSVYTYSGPKEGLGATRSWTSQKGGDGSQTIVQAYPYDFVAYDLTMPSSDTKMLGSISLSGNDAGGTFVYWHVIGYAGRNPIKRWMGFFMNRIMGHAIEESLQNLADLVQVAPMQRPHF